MSESVDLGLGILDHQLLDRDGRRCGKVDDLAIEGGEDETPEVVAILAGPGTWATRAGRLGRFAGWIGGGARVRIPWSEAAEVHSHVQLKKTAADYGLGRGDDRWRKLVERIPGSDR